VEVSLAQAVLIVLLTMASSAGTAGIPGGGIAMMAFMLDLLGLPQTYLALYLVVDRFFDYPITALNVWGDLVVAAVVDADCERQSADGADAEETVEASAPMSSSSS
jgi:proton glutamate symport protein